MSKKSYLVFSCCVMVLSVACVSNYREKHKEINADAIYFDYNIVGDEENNIITVKLQYRIGGPHGWTWLIPNQGKVEFDGETIEPDSSKRNGVWYEVNSSLDEFEGQHIIVFTNSGKAYKEVFDFYPMSLKTKVPAVIKRGDLVFEFDGLNSGDHIRVLLTDTAFYSRGIDRVDTVRDGRISISRSDLDNVTDGPVTIEFYRESQKELRETTIKGGRLSISYGLRRVFQLRDTVVASPPHKPGREEQ
jgi:hypothetical protein